MSYDWKHICAVSQELEKYAELDGPDETTEMLKALRSLVRRPDSMSEKLLAVAVNEMEDILKNYKENSKIETTKQTGTQDVTELIWINEP